MTAGDPPSLDLTQATTMLSVTIAAPAYNKIVQRNPLTGEEFIPDLAERWQVSSDGLTYTFTVRQGVKFHDGAPLTAEDVRYSLARNVDPPKGVLSTWAFVLKPAVQSVDVVSSNTVQIKLRYPLAPLMAILAIDHNPIYPKHVLEAKGDMKTTVLGTGPFKFVSYTPGVGAELVRNNDYFVAGRPYLDGIRVNIVKDNATRLAAIRTGRVLLAGRVFSTLSPSEVKAVQQSIPDLKVYPSPSFNGPEFFMNLRRVPFDDIRVRRAVSLALDRSAAIKIMADGQASAPTYFPVPGWGLPEAELRQMPGFREPKDQDIAEAKQLLSQANVGPSSQLTILARASTPITREAAVFMQGQLASIGLRSTIDVQEDGPFFTAGREARHQAMIFTPTGLLGDPIFMGRFYVPGGDFNFSGNDNDRQLISMWEQQTTTLDVTKRRTLFNDIERYLIKDAIPSIPIVWPTRYIVHQPQVRNFVPGVSDFDFNNLQEIWLTR